MSALRVRISLRLLFLMIALASIVLATWQVNQNSCRLRLEGQKALAEAERGVLLIGIKRRYQDYHLKEDWPFGPHDPEINLKRHDDKEELNARLDDVNEFLKIHPSAHQ